MLTREGFVVQKQQPQKTGQTGQHAQKPAGRTRELLPADNEPQAQRKHRQPRGAPAGLEL